MRKLIVLVIIIISGCAYKVKTPVRPISFIETYKLDTSKIRYDGYYNTQNIVEAIRDINHPDYQRELDLYKRIHIKVFSKSKKILAIDVYTKDNHALECSYFQEIYKRLNPYEDKFLNFTIKNDSIYAYYDCLITVGAGQRVPVFCNYSGFIKNRDTITDWKVIKPYPKDFTKFVIKINQDLFKPHMLYFVKTNAVKCLQIDK